MSGGCNSVASLPGAQERQAVGATKFIMTAGADQAGIAQAKAGTPTAQPEMDPVASFQENEPDGMAISWQFWWLLANCLLINLLWCAGMAAKTLFSQGVSYTYDDVILHPGMISFGADQVCCCALVHRVCVAGMGSR